ncbi:hypothetical protein [Methylorubrum salsuginis]|uniref:Uncharacterized protein n=1 Tax=Methylorubrum salsuginis TaxID=414703 RepID=A0A1I4F314_9HYPH|nr:hypothetical protein [Methylorubrum salsuginis]SFL11156.1 hypothetical protein SAMN04488125_10925 [Methylorubrum salsuginis]
MKTTALILGLILAAATFLWFFYFVPLGCAMNTTGCRERFTVWSGAGLLHFWLPFLVALTAVLYGVSRR